MIDLSHLKNCSSILDEITFPLNKKLSFVTDTRKITKNTAFVAIPGNKVNPLTLLNEESHSLCELVIYQDNEENNKLIKEIKSKLTKTNFLKVKDSVSFIQELASKHIQNWYAINPKNTLFAISGSNGKTTHKEMLSFILYSIKPNKIVATEKNNNNHLGVPLTILSVSDETEFVVLELGSNHPGEIKFLCDLCMPKAGITTNIGATHLEFFGTEQAVFVEEAYLYEAVKINTNDRGFFLQNLDDEFLSTLPTTAGVVTFGQNQNAMAKISFLDQGAKIDFKNESLTVTNHHITGNHNKLNLVTCAFIAFHFYPEKKDQIIQAAFEFRPTKNRSEWMRFQDRDIFLDAYNANPSSMKAALLAFKQHALEHKLTLDQTCVVLGDMNELGENSPQYHEQIGTFVKELGFKNAVFIGRFASEYQKGCSFGQKRLSAKEFKNEFLAEWLKKYSIHFIKGSRSLQLESLFDIT